MTSRLVHDMDTAWTPSAAAITVSADAFAPNGAGTTSNGFRHTAGGVGQSARFDPAASVDLSAFDELRFWINADRKADGSVAFPFYLEFFIVDGPLPGTETRWFVPVNAAGQWEQRLIGLRATDPRSALSRMGFRVIADLPFVCHVDELLAVREEMPIDTERALSAEVGRGMALPGLNGIATTAAPATNDPQVVIPLTPGFGAGNRVRISGGSLGDERFGVAAVTNNAVANTTTIVFDAGTTLQGTFGAPATVSLEVPVVIDTSAGPDERPQPAIILTMLDAREDLGRTTYFDERDSFRLAGTVTVCAVRPAPRAYLLDYQITARAADRAQQVFIIALILQRISADIGLRVNGEIAPVWILPPPALWYRRLDELSPIYVRVGTHLRTTPRADETLVRHATVGAAPYDVHSDLELVEIDL